MAILGVPFDDRVSHRPGTRFGPRAIREANSTSGTHSLALGVEPFEVLDVVDAGDVAIVPAWPERGHAITYRGSARCWRAAPCPSILGGDHSITWPVVSAVAEASRPAGCR